MKHNYLITIIFLFFASFALFADKIPIIYFFESDCPNCRRINRTVLPSIIEKYGDKIEFKKRNVAEMKNFEAMLAFEAKYSIPPKEVPTFYTSYGVTWDPKAIKEELSNLIKKELLSPNNGKYRIFIKEYLNSASELSKANHVTSQLKKECERFEVEKAAPLELIIKKTVKSKSNQKKLEIYEFRKSGCSSCNRLSLSLGYLEKKYPKEVKVNSFNIKSNSAKILLEAYCQKYNIEESSHLATPALFFGSYGIVGEGSFKELNLIPLILNAIETRFEISTKKIMPDDIALAEKRIYDRYRTISWSTVLFAGFLDGINPCAFVTIIFLLSYLSLMKYSRRNIGLVGISFTFSVFITYLLIGLGLLKFLSFIQEIEYIYDILYFVAILFAITIGFLNIYDYYKIKRGSLNDMSLKLNKSLRKRINAVIRKNVKVKHFVIGAFGMGFLISILELACTGQVYLPTVLFILNTQGIQMRAVSLLIAYNVAFVMPLIIIFILFMRGTGNEEKLSEWLKKHAGKIKLAMGILFIFFAILLYIFRQ